MKKVAFSTIIGLFFMIVSGYSQTGSSCSTPSVISTLPFSQTGLNTANGGNPFDSTMACQSPYMTGMDYVFAYTPTTDEIVNIALTGTGQGVGLFVANECPSVAGASCIAEVESLAGNPTANSVTLHHDTTYYIIVSTRAFTLFGQTINNTTAFDINITSVNPNDLVLQTLLKPQSGCGLTSTDTVKVKIKNNGLVAATSTQIAYMLDGGTPVIESLPASIALGDSIIFNFAQLADLSATIDHQLKVWIIFPADGIHSNDTINSVISPLPVVNVYPYLQNFESGAGGWYAEGSGSTWALGIPDKDSISSAASGVNAWVTNLTGNCSQIETSYLYSPCLDFSALTLPIIRLKTNYAMSSGLLANVKLQTSTDQGQTWTTVGSQEPDWYNSTSGWSGTTANNWETMKHKLFGLGGNNSVRVRIAFSGGYVANPGVGIDDIEIYDSPANDLSVLKIVSPTSRCGLGSEAIVIRIKNEGTASQNNYNIAYNVNGSGFVSQLQTAPLASGDSIDLAFATPYDFSAIETFHLLVKTMLASDENLNNDTLSSIIVNTLAVNSFPYLETFESGDGGWVPGGTSSSWALGLPAGSVIQGAASGTHAWKTNLTGVYNASENSYIESPCLNLSSLTLPVVEVMLNYDAGLGVPGFPMGAAYGYFEYSTDNGTTWATIGANGDATNWYNGSLTTGWTGTSSGWVMAKHTVPALAGQADAKLRFHFNGMASAMITPTEGFAVDNIHIYEMPQKDISVVSITSPSSNCNLSSENISVKVANFGAASQSGIPIKYTINGGTSYTAGTVPGPVNTNDTIDFTFATPANFSALQSYDVRIFTDLTGDEDRSNDTIKTVVVNAPVVSIFPYLEGFETSTHNWIAGGTNSSWEVGTITNQTITASTNGNCWVTNASGNHNTDENSWVNSPCFNFSSLTNPYIKLNISYDTYNETAINQLSTVLEMSTDGGSTWNVLGVTGDSTNWYNSSSVIPGMGSEGWQGTSGWVTAKHLLSGSAGLNNVKLRIHFGAVSEISMPITSTPTAGFAFDQVEIRDCETPQLSFTASMNQRTVTLNNASVGATGYLWDFGDGSTGTEPNPAHTYANFGQYTITLIGYNECTSDTISHEVNVSDVGIDANSLTMSITCLPNPTTGVVNLKFDNVDTRDVALSVVDIAGKTLYSEQLSIEKGQKVYPLDLGHLVKGIYFVQISTSKSKVINKIVLQ